MVMNKIIALSFAVLFSTLNQASAKPVWANLPNGQIAIPQEALADLSKVLNGAMKAGDPDLDKITLQKQPNGQMRVELFYGYNPKAPFLKEHWEVDRTNVFVEDDGMGISVIKRRKFGQSKKITAHILPTLGEGNKVKSAVVTSVWCSSNKVRKFFFGNTRPDFMKYFTRVIARAATAFTKP